MAIKIKGALPGDLAAQMAEADEAEIAALDGVELDDDGHRVNGTNGSNGHARIADVDDSWRGYLHCKRNKDGDLIEVVDLHNVCVYLRYHPEWAGVIARDAFRETIAFTKEPPWSANVDRPVSQTMEWSDNDTTRAINWFARMTGYSLKATMTDQAVNAVADTHVVHEVRDYLNALQWDERPRVDALMHRYLGVAEGSYSRAVGVCFMIGAVARVMQPGCKVDTMPILEGPQGSYKSTAVRTLAGAKWFSDSALDIGHKDAAQNLPGVWIYELGEIDSYSKREVGTMKAFISSPVDRYRASYGKRAGNYPRQVVFVGTVNPSTYLHDETGGRRFWPVKVGAIDIQALAADRDQLWAEAVVRYRQEEPWYFTRELEVEAGKQQERRREADPWEAKIADWMNPQRRHVGVTTGEVLGDLLKIEVGKHTRADAMRVGRILQTLGLTRFRTRSEGDWQVLEWRYKERE